MPATQQANMAKPDLTIVIVNWNSKDYVQSCIASLVKTVSGIQYETIVIDSASFDGCGQMLNEYYPQVRFIQSEQNVGFGKANNIAASQATSDTIMFLNPDTEVLGQAVNKLYQAYLGQPDAGIMGCRLLNSDRTLQASCVQSLPTITNQLFDIDILRRQFASSKLWASAVNFEGLAVEKPVAVEVVSGACMIVSKTIFDEVGGFSKEYFMYAEDLDLCYKTQTAGYVNYYFAGAEIVHHGGGSTQQKYSRFSVVMIPESVSRLMRKMHGGLYSLCYRAALGVSAILRLLLLLIMFPIFLSLKKTSAWSPMFEKWAAILQWSLGLERWVYQYAKLNITDQATPSERQG